MLCKQSHTYILNKNCAFAAIFSFYCSTFSYLHIYFLNCLHTNRFCLNFSLFLRQPNESGFVLLGDLSLETSTDSDYDDFSMCPPSPCDVEFENANIVIDGKSSIRQKSKEATVSKVNFINILSLALLLQLSLLSCTCSFHLSH